MTIIELAYNYKPLYYVINLFLNFSAYIPKNIFRNPRSELVTFFYQ